MIKFMVDSTAYVTKEYAEKHDITVIPLKFLYKDKEYIEGFPGSYDEFFEDFTKSKVFPKTSQPSLETFTNEFNNAIENGDEVIFLALSSTLSGTYSVANLAKQECLNPEKVHIVDTLANVQTVFGLLMEAVNLRDNGATCEEIIEKISHYMQNSYVTFVPDTLEYLAKGGRIGKVSATLGSILNIKPIIIFKNGVLSDKKSFGMQKAIKDMIMMIPEKIKRLFVLHIANTKFFEMLKNMINQWLDKRPDKDKIEVYTGEVGPVTASHVGPAVGLAWTAE